MKSTPDVSENRFVRSISRSSIRNLLHRSISAKQKPNPNARDDISDLENDPPVNPNIQPTQSECPFNKQSLSESPAYNTRPAVKDGQDAALAPERQNRGSDIYDGTEENPDHPVKVVVRIKPVKTENETIRKASSDSLSVGDRKFTFDSVFDSKANQEDLFQLVGVPLIRDALSGYNTSILSYGQTGSGKTYTMWGPSSSMLEDPSPCGQQGIAPRIFQRLFLDIQREKENSGGKQINYQCRCSFLEIYNGQINDLLDQTQRNLEIKDDQKNGFYVENLTEEYVNSYEDVAQILMKGLSSRKVGTTGANSKSSRSHVVFSFMIESWSKGTAAKGFSTTRTSKITLVDLAAAERNKPEGESKQCTNEEKYLKKSLSQLGNVVNALTARAKPGLSEDVLHRRNCLTHLLRESFGGNSKLTVLCFISPENRSTSQTLSTLRFGARVKCIRNEPVINEISEEDVNDLSDQIRLLKEELIRAKADVYHSTKSRDGYYKGRSARESLNQLRVSLNRTLILPKIETSEEEEAEITIDEDDVKELQQQLNKLQVPYEENHSELSYERDSVHSSFVTASSEPELLSDDEIASRETEFEDADLVEDCNGKKRNDSSQTPKADDAADSELRTGISVNLCHQSLSLQDPVLSESPKIRNSQRKSMVLSSSTILASVSESSKFVSARESMHRSSSLRSSKIFPGPIESLSASLHRGLQIIDQHQRNSLNRSSVSFSFDNVALSSSVGMVDSSVQNSLMDVSPDVERSLSVVCPSCKQTFEESSNETIVKVGVYGAQNTDEPTDQVANIGTVEATSRNEELEILCKEQAAKIEELNLLLEHYKQQNEKKIVSDEDFPPTNENLLQNCNGEEDNQVEVVKETYEKTVQEDDEKLINSDTKEKQTLLKEIEDLKSQLQICAAESPSKSIDKQRSSLLSRYIQLRNSVDFRNTNEEDLEKEKLKWTEMESEWISLTDELRVNIETQRRRAEKAETELKQEKMCKEELEDAIQRAVLGHVKFIEHYTELQEKYNDLAGKHRGVMEWVAGIKKAVTKAGGKKGTRFAKSLSAELSLLRVEKERERMLLKMENKSLKIQLRDTAEAVHAAGELLVRLKEAEAATSSAQESLDEAIEENEKLKKMIQKLRRKHKMEVITMKQCLAESRLPESALTTNGKNNLREADCNDDDEFGAI